MDLDLSNDFAAVTDGTESVVLLRRGSTPGSPGTQIAHALRGSVTRREAAQSSGLYTTSDAAWHLPVAELLDCPRLGDVVLDADGRRWTILQVQLVALRTRWRCVARQLAIAHGLDDTITVLKASYAKGQAGAAEPTWQPWKTGIRARIQPLAADMATRPPSACTRQRYRIFVEEELPLDHTHRIRGPEGALYRVLGTTAAERIGQLQTVEVERV